LLIKAKADFNRFYYDIALSASSAQLDDLLDLSDPSHIVFGSDFPYEPQLAIGVLVAEYAAFVAVNWRGSRINSDRLRENSLWLLDNKRAE
jgi:predicted TIM-barrel fold metal-dependent hydrolase